MSLNCCVMIDNMFKIRICNWDTATLDIMIDKYISDHSSPNDVYYFSEKDDNIYTLSKYDDIPSLWNKVVYHKDDGSPKNITELSSHLKANKIIYIYGNTNNLRSIRFATGNITKKIHDEIGFKYILENLSEEVIELWADANKKIQDKYPNLDITTRHRRALHHLNFFGCHTINIFNSKDSKKMLEELYSDIDTGYP